MSKVAEPSADRMAEAMQVMAQAIMKLDPQKAREILKEINTATNKGA